MGASGTILLVDDLPENLQLLSEMLMQRGYSIRSVTSGKMALKTLAAKPVDVILLDIKMPEMDGYQVCQALKQDPNLSKIPVIFLSALDDTFDKVKAFEVGAVDYITKPFQIEEVIARLENQLTIDHQRKLLEEEVCKRQEAEEILYQSRALLASLLNSSMDGIAALEAVRNPTTGTIEDFRCLVVNPILAKVFNRSREDLIGKLVIKRLLHRIDPDLFDRFVKVVETSEPLKDEFYYAFEQSYWYHCVAVKLGDGFSIMIRDITDRKTMELNLKEVNSKLRVLANIDELTQIANRRHFNHFLAKQWRFHFREQNPLGLILMDIDHFKTYNDYYGHLQGDECLAAVARCIMTIPQRPLDLVARYGGEEFAVILPHTNPEGAFSVAEAIRHAILALKIPHIKSGVSSDVTLSLGVASLIPNVETRLETLIQYADRALYCAKVQGRNRTIVYETLNEQYHHYQPLDEEHF